jgi:predicted LPLAT superfamily acyltransferase
MPLWEGKTRGGYFGYGIFIFLLRKVNIRFSYALLRVVAVYFWIFSNKKSLIYFYHNRLQFNKWLSYKAIYNNYVMLGECLLDKIVVMGKIKNSFTYDFDGENYLHQLAEDKKGGILIGAHVGNWEIASHFLRRINIKVNIVMLDAEHQKIKKLLQNVLKERRVSIIPIKNSYDHLYAIEQALNRGEFIAIHGDRFLPGAKTANCRFLNEEAQFPTGPFYMASKFKAPVCFVSTIKTNRYHYQFKATMPEMLPFNGKIKTRNLYLKKLIEHYVKNLETLVRENPTQWFNFYQFWNIEN